MVKTASRSIHKRTIRVVVSIASAPTSDC